MKPEYNMSPARFPHCDQRILHAPGKCSVCDLFPELQFIRTAWDINFTGEYEVGKYLCPAEHARGQNINRWPGNVPAPIFPTAEEVDEAVASIQEMLSGR